jgi:hypothetical protein
MTRAAGEGAAVRALIVLTATAPSLGVLVFFPHSGVVTDSYAASSGYLAPLVASALFLLSAVLEHLALGRWEGLAAFPFYAMAIGSTTLLPLTQRGVADCCEQCIFHRVAVVSLGVVELWLMRRRGVGSLTLAATGLVIVATIAVYLVAVHDGGVYVSESQMSDMLKLHGVFEICLLLWVRLIAASVPIGGYKEVVAVRV